ncbi:MAG: DUF1559 domain-containing protein, partial [Caldilineaceae bacterium]|nr:DUF1559 domain-containing protein [Caldilineaceae bacterium]
PAVQAAREAARRSQCQNNLKQLALGMLLHEATHKHFSSGGWGWRWTGDPDRGTGKSQPGGWNYPLLPFIEQQAVFELGRDNVPDVITDPQRNGALTRDQPPIAGFVCPTRRSAVVYPRPKNMSYHNARSVSSAGVIDYAANSGSTVMFYTDGPTSMSDALKPWPNWKSDNYASKTGVAFTRSEVRIAQITDGTSNTYMLGEKYLRTDDYKTGNGTADDFGMYEGSAYDTHRWCYYDSVSPAASYVPMQDRPGAVLPRRFGSPHSACQMVMCDGSARSVNFSIDPQIHSRYGGRNDGLPIDNDR